MRKYVHSYLPNVTFPPPPQIMSSLILSQSTESICEVSGVILSTQHWTYLNFYYVIYEEKSLCIVSPVGIFMQRKSEVLLSTHKGMNGQSSITLHNI